MKLLLIVTTLLATAQLQAAAADNQINCQAKDLGTVDQLICSDPELLKQDQQLAEVYQQALVKAANEISVRYYPTTPATLIADYGDQVSLMYQQADQTYVGRNEKLSEQNGVFSVQWGYETPLMSCKPK